MLRNTGRTIRNTHLQLELMPQDLTIYHFCTSAARSSPRPSGNDKSFARPIPSGDERPASNAKAIIKPKDKQSPFINSTKHAVVTAERHKRLLEPHILA